MGIKDPVSPVTMNARRPEGRPAAGINTVENVIIDFHASGVNSRSCAFLQSRFLLRPAGDTNTMIVPDITTQRAGEATLRNTRGGF